MAGSAAETGGSPPGPALTWTVNEPTLLYHPNPSLVPRNKPVAPAGMVICRVQPVAVTGSGRGAHPVGEGVGR